MAKLDTALLTELQSLITPLAERSEDRRALLELAVGNSPVYGRIDFSGATDTFTIHVLTTLAKYGEISAGRQALWALLEVVRSRVGVNYQKRIDELRPDIEALSASYHDLGSGAIFAHIYNKAGEIPERTKPERLFGHTDLLQRLNELVDGRKDILLTGYGGTGKTALAATLADQRLAEGKGPILWVQARRGNSDILFEVIASRFNQKENLDRVQSGDQIKFMQTMLVDAGVKLLVLDDVRNENIVVPMRQVTKDLPMLLTSRHQIANVYASEKVTNLSPNDALDLLIHHARNQEVSEAEYRADPDARQLCQELGYHAFGIVAAGRWLNEKKREAKGLLERIAQRRLTPPTIPMPKSFVDEGRETVKIVLDESFSALQPAAQGMIKVFGSLFEPQATTALLTICAGYGDQLDAEDALDELVLWNLATRTGNYYTIHDMVHAYAEAVYFGNAEPNRQPTVVAVQRYVKEYSQDFNTLEFDQPNILRAAEAADDETRASIMQTLTLDGYFNARGHTLDFLAQLDRVLTNLRERKNEETLRPHQLEMFHYLLGKRGDAYFDRGDYDKALKTYEESLHLANDVSRSVILSGVIGRTLSALGAHVEAGKYFERGYKLAGEAKDGFLLSFVLEQQAWAAGHNEDHVMARQIAAKQVAINERLLETNQDRDQENALSEALIYSLVNLGSAEIRIAIQQQAVIDTIETQRQIQAALNHFQRAEQIAVSINNTFLRSRVLNAVAEGYHFLDKREKAYGLFKDVRELYRKRGMIREENDVIAFLQKYGYPTTSDEEAVEEVETV